LVNKKFVLKREVSYAGMYKTLLIERFSQLGGLGTLAGVGNFSFCGPLEGLGRIFEDILSNMEKLKGFGEEYGWGIKNDFDFIRENMGKNYLGFSNKKKDIQERKNYMFDHNILPLVLQYIAQESNVNLLLHTEVVDVIRTNNKVETVITHNRDLLQGYEAKYIIDATGDGLVAQHAGAEILKDHFEHPDLIPPSLMIFLRKTDKKQEQSVFEEYNQEEIPQYQVWDEPDGKIGLKLHFEGFDVGTGRGFSEAEKYIREKIPSVVRHYQQKYNPKYKFDYAAPLLGIREGRRIKGDYVLSTEDVRSGKKFNDSIAFGLYPIDTTRLNESLPPYQIPFRSLLVESMSNMLIVGRCMSADRLAMSSLRVMPTCCLVGQAAGIAVAIACRNGTSLRQIEAIDIRKRLISSCIQKETLQKYITP